MLNKEVLRGLIFFLVIGLVCCKTNKRWHGSTDGASLNQKEVQQVAASEEVERYMKGFEGRGDLTDNSTATPPDQALAAFRHPSDLTVDLLLAEPQVNQPVEVSFDHRGRLWVVQYRQYPYPEGLRVVSMDDHLRAKFDKTKPAPPDGVKGADKITIFEDTNGDGRYDKSTDAITGLNIATSVTLGRGHIWVLSPPFLLAYPDKNNDGLPEGDPVVHLEGFGLEDTHAVANSLRWGPDGWLYGAQGSTTTASISSAVSKNIAFEGQAIWRYHPETKVFEVHGEGGGNTFDVEIDEKGRIFSGDNGTDRGVYYKQGAYYRKNWGKHGPLTNPYAFGYLNNMPLTGDKIRFTHAWIKYDGGSLPPAYNHAIIALNPLQSFLQLSRLSEHGSTFSIADESRILQTSDHWFRPVDITVGPDGAVYLADWYDSRLTHVDPRDTWHKSSGRIYRIRNRDAKKAQPKFDISKYSNSELIQLLSHPNKWYRQQALVQFGNRKDKQVLPKLTQLLLNGSPQEALESLWAIHLSGGFSDQIALSGLRHSDPHVRMWSVRLIGDSKKASNILAGQLVQLAGTEQNLEVRSQLAATAKRLPGSQALPIVRNLLMDHSDAADSDIPLQIWWAIESKVDADRTMIVKMLEEKSLWENPVMQGTLLGRLMQRFVMAGDRADFAMATRLLQLAPTPQHGKILINGLQEGLRGQEITKLPPELLKALEPYQADFKEEALALSLRQGNKEAIDRGLEIMSSEKAGLNDRLTYIRIFGEVNEPRAVAPLLKIADNQISRALQQSAINSLQRYNEPEIGAHIVKNYVKLRDDPQVRNTALALLVTRVAWARLLLQDIIVTKKISAQDLPEQLVRRLKLLNDPAIEKSVEQVWPNVRLATSEEKNKRVSEVAGLLKAGSGNAGSGKEVFQNVCRSCHKLFENGGSLGPDLTGYERGNVNYLLTHIIDPNIDIREGYDYYQVTTSDDRTLVGTISARKGTTITLQPVGEDPVTLSASQIKSMKAQSISLMPERLLDGLSDQQIKDLFAYIMKMD